MTIYLMPENPSSLGEDTFWTWFNRVFENTTFDPPPSVLNDDDIALVYSTIKKPIPTGGISICLCWELHHEMRDRLGLRNLNSVIARIENNARQCTRRVVSSELMLPVYSKFGSVQILPIGVDTSLFKPLLVSKTSFGIPKGVPVYFWCGTSHVMKGYDLVQSFASKNPEACFIIVWKSQKERGRSLPNAKEFVCVTQEQLANLMNCSDAFLLTSRLRPYYMVEWEAMACGLSCIDLAGIEKEFIIPSDPRRNVFDLNWSRLDAMRVWRNYLDDIYSITDL